MLFQPRFHKFASPLDREGVHKALTPLVFMTQTHLTDTRFDSFDLDKRILQGLADAGFTRCTPIQAETLPIALSGQDVAGQAQTGTGKTAAFVVATLQRLLTFEPRPRRRPNQPRALMVAPTRELAVQIHKDTEMIASHCGFRLGLVYGGTGYQRQRDEIGAGVDILIGTPGRLIDYFKQRVFDLKELEVAVIDEADRMFDLGFIKDIRYLLRRMPPADKRLGMLFSATLSYRVTELAYEHMNHPHPVEIEPDQVTADRVAQGCYMVANDEKIPLLIGLLRGLEDARVIVFANTKRATEGIWGFLEGNGFRAAILSGDVPQKKRLSLLRAFQHGELPILVATDVAARGLHIPGVTHVVNYDLPEDAEDYVHRIGRTARAGATGDAISFVCETFAFCLPDIEKFIGAKIPAEPVRGDMLVQVDPRSRVRVPRRPRDDRRGGGGRQGMRAGKGRGGSGGRSAHAQRKTSEASTAKGDRAKDESKTGDAAAPKRRRRRRRPSGKSAGSDGDTAAPPTS
jgi:ATP-dependent RNA helicase RhlB